MSDVQSAVEADLGALGEPLASSALAVAAVLLAQRLDASPGDREAVLLARELRMVLGELRGLADAGGVSDVERWLEGISNPTFRGPGD